MFSSFRRDAARRGILRLLMVAAALLGPLLGGASSAEQSDTSASVLQERFRKVKSALNSYAGQHGRYPDRLVDAECGPNDRAFMKDPYTGDQECLRYESSGSSYTVRCASTAPDAPCVSKAMRRRAAPPAVNEGTYRKVFRSEPLETYGDFVESVDCRNAHSGDTSVKRLIEHFRVDHQIAWSDDDILTANRSRCEAIVRKAFARSQGRVYMTPETAKAQCAIMRLALSCDPEDMVSVLRLGSEAPALWSHHIFREALLHGVRAHAFDSLPSSSWRRIAAELVHALRSLEEQERQKEMCKRLSPREPFEIKRDLAAVLRISLRDLVVGGVVTKEELHSIAQDERGKAKTTAARECMDHFTRDLDAGALGRPATAGVDEDKVRSRAERLQDPAVRKAVLRIGRIDDALNAFGSTRGYFPRSLDEIAQGLDSEDMIDPLTSQPFVYEADGSTYVLRSIRADESGVGDCLVRYSPFAVDPEVAERARAFHAAKPKPSFNAAGKLAESTPRPIVDEESLHKMKLLELVLQPYRLDKGKFPGTLQEVFVSDDKYIRMVADPTLLSFADAAKANHCVTPPSGYQWFYRCSRDGQDFLLGLRRDGETAPDVERQPVISTQEPAGYSLRMPGTPQARSAVEGFQE